MCRDLKNCNLRIKHCPEDSKEICRFGECQKHCGDDNQCTDKEKCYKDYCATACIEDRYNLIDHGQKIKFIETDKDSIKLDIMASLDPASNPGLNATKFQW